MRNTRTACARMTAMAAFAVAVACGGSSPPSLPGASGIQVAGIYDTAVELAENSCTGIMVAPQPTTIAHTAGATRLSVSHAGATYSGTLEADGSFRTDSATVSDGQGTSSTILITGRFTATGFTATVTVDVQGPGGARCRYVVRWTGTKRGAPNVIPGG